MSNSLGDSAFCKNLTTTTITDINGQTGLVGQVLASTANGIDWVVGSGVLQDLQSVCTIGNQTNTTIIMDSAITIETNNLTCPIHIGAGIVGLIPNTIAIGNTAGGGFQSAGCISIGLGAGNFQGLGSLAIGENAGNSQGISSVAIGNNAGNSQLDNAIAIGNLAANVNQGIQAISIGASAGQLGQEGNAIAIGFEAGNDTQLKESIAIGLSAGFKILAQGAVAIGAGALSNANGVGLNSVAIGRLAMDTPPLFDKNIILNATGASFPDFSGGVFPAPTDGGRFYVGQIRKDDTFHNPAFVHTLSYDEQTGEVFWN